MFLHVLSPLFHASTSLLCISEASEDLVRALVLLNCAGGMNNKAIVDDWRIKVLFPVLLFIDFLLKQRGIASAIFERVKDRYFSYFKKKTHLIVPSEFLKGIET